MPPIYKFDYVRYVILQKFGGAYFDMDVEVIDPSFFSKLQPHKMYFMEGTTGTYLENSIMITPSDLRFSEYWIRLKKLSQYKLKNTPKIKLTPRYVVWVIGPGLLSDFFVDHKVKTGAQQWEILGYNQFSSPTSTISYTRHYQSSVWNPVGKTKRK